MTDVGKTRQESIEKVKAASEIVVFTFLFVLLGETGMGRWRDGGGKEIGEGGDGVG